MRANSFKVMVAAAIVTGSLAFAQVAPSMARPSSNTQYGRLPLLFEANQGQLASHINFVSRGSGYSAYLTSEGMILSLRPTSATTHVDDTKNASSRHVQLSFRLQGASRHAVAIGENQQPGKVNYFVGRDRSKWLRNVPTYAQARYKNVYPGIDLIYYGNQRQLEYDFEVTAGADPNQIRFSVEGARNMKVAANGNLVLDTTIGQVSFQAPKLYQAHHGKRVPVEGGYSVDGAGKVSFHLAAYDHHRQLVIDPVLNYSTYLGGSGTEQVSGITVDSNGNAYVVGSTDSTDFPLTTLGSGSAGSQVFVAKLDATGSNLLFCDFLGGAGQDNGYGIALDATNNVVVTGSTASNDFPLVNAFQATYPGSYNAFLAKISSDGSSLTYSSYFGGNGSDTPSAVAVDASGNTVIAGYTSSTNLPLMNAFQSSVSANQGEVYGTYGFLAKFNPDGSSLVYSTYLGGSSNVPTNCSPSLCWPEPYSMINGLALDKDGNAYAAGTTNTYNFPVSEGAYQSADSTSSNGSIGFLSKLDNAGNLAYSTYFGGSLLTVITAVAVDTNASAYVSGLALNDGTFPVTTSSICDQEIYGSSCNFAFITKFDSLGSNLVYSTFLGPNNYAVPQAMTLDSNNNAYIVGATSSDSFGTVSGVQNYQGSNDILLVEVDANANSQLFATYLGGAKDDAPSASGITVDAEGNIYLTGTTDSTEFPTTQSAVQSTFAGNNDAFVMKIGPASTPGVALNPVSLSFTSEPLGTASAAQTVLLRNMGSSALSVSSISAVGDFSETDTCGNAVPAAGSCTISVSFTPTAAGTRTGSIVIADDASGPQSISLSGMGNGPAVDLSPATLDFSSITTGTSSQAQVLTLTNSGNTDLSITGLQVSGDFSQTNNCPGTLSASSSCSINVTFTPSATGPRTGSVMITDNAPGSPHAATLTGVGSAPSSGPAAGLSPASLNFGGVAVGSSSQAQVLTLTNTGNANLLISAVQISGDFSQTNNCPAALSSASSCAIRVTFKPSATGTRTGSVTISDNAAGSPHTSTLAGVGGDFTLSSAGTSDSVSAGTTATYTLHISPASGSFSSPVTLSCSGAPQTTTCNLSAVSVTPGANSVSVTVNVSTTAPTTAANISSNRIFYGFWMQFPSLGLFGLAFAGSKRQMRKKAVLIALLLIIAAGLMTMVGCAGGTGIAPQGQPGTPSGTYTITVSGTSGGLHHSLPLTLVVQ